MKKFSALIKKEWHTHGSIVLVPIWITLGFYFLLLISFGFAYFKGDFNLQLAEIQAQIKFPAINYYVNVGSVFMPGLMSLLFIIIFMQSALNEDIQKNCELFHRSQPISIWLRSFSKFIFGLMSNWLVFLMLVILNFIIINIILAFFNQLSFYPAFFGMFQMSVKYLKTGLIFGSIAFFCSAIFKDKAVFQGFAILVGINFLFLILNVMFKWNLPLPWNYFVNLIKNPGMEVLDAEADLWQTKQFIRNNWNAILWNWKTLLQIIVSGSLFVISTYIHKNKEIK